MDDYSDDEFEMKLANLNCAQTSIVSLSEWCLKRHQYHQNIIIMWMNVLRKLRVKKRLNLFYLANHVIQSSKNKKYINKFVNGWAPTIEEAMSYVRDNLIQSSIARIIQIWKDRMIYNDDYLDHLTALLTTPIEKLKYSDPVEIYQVNKLASDIHSYLKSKQITDISMKMLRGVYLPLNSDESIEDIIKDSTRIHQIQNELILSKAKIDKCTEVLANECLIRAQLLHTLEEVKPYFDKKNGKAYHPYMDRLKLEKSNMESLLNSMSAYQNNINRRRESIITSDSYNTVQACNEIMNNWSTNGSPALPFCHETMPDQNISFISKTDSQRKQHSNDLKCKKDQFLCKGPQHDSTKRKR